MHKLGTEGTQKVLLEHLNTNFRAKGKCMQGLLSIRVQNVVTYLLDFKDFLVVFFFLLVGY